MLYSQIVFSVIYYEFTFEDIGKLRENYGKRYFRLFWHLLFYTLNESK